MNGLTTVDPEVLAKQRGRSVAPCYHYVFGGYLHGMSMCRACGFHKSEHSRDAIIFNKVSLLPGNGVGRGARNRKAVK